MSETAGQVCGAIGTADRGVRHRLGKPAAAGAVLFRLDLAAASVAWGACWLAAGLPTLPCAVYFAADLLALYAMGLHRRDAILHTRRSLGRVPLVVGLGAAGAWAANAGLGALWPELAPPGSGAKAFGLAAIAFSSCAFATRLALWSLRERGLLRRRLLIVGAGKRAWDLRLMLGREGRGAQYDVTFLHHPSLGERDPRLDPAQVRQCDELEVLETARAVEAEAVVVAPDERRGMDLHRLLACKIAGLPVVPYLTFLEKEIRRLDLKRMELGWIVEQDGFQFGLMDRALKRLFDVAAAGLLLLPASPFLLLSAVAIRLEGPGPVLYRQERVTQDGRRFWILKLRTMRTDAESGRAVWAAAGDSRITRVGRFLRRTRIDELPQLLNVLRGDMSFVGPRPERPVFVAELAEQLPLYRERHMVKAGLTGWAQVNYPYGATVDDARSKLSYDLYYVKNFSVLFDLLILLQTLRVVLWPGAGAVR